MTIPAVVSFAQFEDALRTSDVIRTKVADKTFAQQLYAAMCNTDIYHQDYDTPVSCSWRYAGGVVADLRDQNEDYLDFYCSGGEGHIAPDVLDALAPLGWRIVEPEDHLFSPI